MSRKTNSFTTIDASIRLMHSMEIAIDNMIEEVKRPIDQEVNGSARKAELQSVKQTAIDCKELIVERQRLEEMITKLKDTGSIEEDKSFSAKRNVSSQISSAPRARAQGRTVKRVVWWLISTAAHSSAGTSRNASSNDPM